MFLFVNLIWASLVVVYWINGEAAADVDDSPLSPPVTSFPLLINHSRHPQPLHFSTHRWNPPVSQILPTTDSLPSSGLPDYNSRFSLKRNLLLYRELCSDPGENQRHPCSVLPTSTSPARVSGRASRHLDSDEAVLGRGTVWTTVV